MVFKKGFRPFWTYQFAIGFPRRASASDFLATDGVNLGCRIETALPTLAADGENFVGTTLKRVKRENINVAMIRVLVLNPVRVISAGAEI